MAELVDAPDLGSGAARRVGSSPSIPTIFYHSQGVAQVVECWSWSPEVAGSIPVALTIFYHSGRLAEW